MRRLFVHITPTTLEPKAACIPRDHYDELAALVNVYTTRIDYGDRPLPDGTWCAVMHDSLATDARAIGRARGVLVIGNGNAATPARAEHVAALASLGAKPTHTHAEIVGLIAAYHATNPEFDPTL